MENKYLSYDEEINGEHWAYLMHLAELAKKQLTLLDEILEGQYRVELELYYRQ